MHPTRMNLYRRIAILEASVVSQEKRCLLIGWKRPENGAYDKVVKDWPCTRDKSRLRGSACCHWVEWKAQVPTT